MARSLDAGVLVFDDALTPGQVLNLKKRTGLEIQDRPGVIVTIFQARAHTAEAKLQVELARCRYEVPLLKGLGQQMSRTGGGIGTRGPGETEFERHRRKLERRIRDIDKKLQVVRQRREYQRKRRSRSGFPTVALVGYTNSGKSTLLRTLSGDGSILARDQLFSTLDTAVRRVTLPGGREILMADTVDSFGSCHRRWWQRFVRPSKKLHRLILCCSYWRWLPGRDGDAPDGTADALRHRRWNGAQNTGAQQGRPRRFRVFGKNSGEACRSRRDGGFRERSPGRRSRRSSPKDCCTFEREALEESV